MDTAALVAVIIAGLTGASLIITSIVLLIRGAFLLGRVVNHVEVLDQKVDNLEQKVDTLTDAVNDLRVEMVAGQEKLRTEMAAVEMKLRAEMTAVETRLRAEMADMEMRLRAEMADMEMRLRAEMTAGYDRLANAIDQLRSELHQTNQILIGLANHGHDTDGRIIFTLPTTPGR